MIEHKCEQGTAEWRAVRSGIFTASSAEVALPLPGALKRGEVKYSTKRADYMYKLATETILGQPVDEIDPQPQSVSSLFWPARGLQMEPEAVEALERYTRDRQIKLGKIRKVGFITTDDRRIGCSPDRMIEKSKTSAEIKCPASWTQAEYLDASEDYWRTEYYAQVQCQMLVTGYQQVILFSYHPRMPAVYRNTWRDQPYIEKLYAEIVKFNGELDAMVSRLRMIGGFKPFESDQ